MQAQDTALPGSTAASTPYTLTVTDVNEAPTALRVAAVTNSLAENTGTAARIKVADMAVTDDALGVNTLTLQGADANCFEIEGSALYLKAGTVLDYETKTSYNVEVQAQDKALPGSAPVMAGYQLKVTDMVNTSGLKWNLSFSTDTPEAARHDFQAAADFWSSWLTDDVTVNLTVGLAALGTNVLGSADTTRVSSSYARFMNSTVADETSYDDVTAVASLSAKSSFGMLINHTSDNPHGADSATAYLDDDAGINNKTVRMSSANAKALGLIGASSNSDGSILFSTVSPALSTTTAATASTPSNMIFWGSRFTKSATR